MPPNAALHGIAVDQLMRWNLIALLACFAASHLWLIVAIFRKKSAVIPSAAEEPQQSGHAPQRSMPKQQRSSWSLSWFLLPILCAMYAWMAITAQRLWAANRFEGASPGSMQVEVVGQQFEWYFRYPGEDAAFGVTRPQLVNAAAGNPLGLDPKDPRGNDDLVSSALVLPVGREVDLRIRSLDVIHGFFIPAMRLKQNAVPGLVLHVHFTPIAAGTYPILCSQVCGLGHARMQAELRVVSPEAYQDWLKARERQHAQETAQ
ncbi:MAG TPA: cytochrome C oxidase subunit II [Acidobacteriaceae bacterium]